MEKDNPTIAKEPSRIWNLLKIALALILLGFILSKTDIQQLRSVSGHITWDWIGLRFFIFCLVLAAKTLQYWVLLGKPVPYSRMLGIVIVQNAFANFVTNSAGIASYLTLLHTEAGVKLSRAGVVFAITKVGDLLSMWLFLLLSSLFVWDEIPGMHAIVLFLLVGIFLGLVVVLTTILLRQRFVSVLQSVIARLRLDRIKLIQRGYESLASMAEQDQGQIFSLFFKAIGLSLLYMCMSLALYYSGLRMFDVPVTFWAVIFVAIILQLLSIVPVQILGGLGVTELTSMYLYGVFDVPQNEIVAAVLGLRMIYYLMNLAVLGYLPVKTFFLRHGRNTPSET